jgi:hypothetical protein
MAGWTPLAKMADVSTGGIYAVMTSSLDTGVSAPQVLRVRKPDTNEFYYVSVRTKQGFDTALATQYADNVSIHRANGTRPTKTYLLKNLAAGQTFSDSINGITLVNQGIANGVATVGLTFGASVCARSNPTVSVSPASLTGAPGAALAYTVSVTNKNTAACGISTFNLAQALPAGFTGILSANSLALAANASGSATWRPR